jgi:hypothetical protein
VAAADVADDWADSEVGVTASVSDPESPPHPAAVERANDMSVTRSIDPPIMPSPPLRHPGSISAVAAIQRRTFHLLNGRPARSTLVNYGIGRGDLMLMGAVTGAVVGGLQSVVLARRGIAGALWWVVVNPPAWALA